MVDEHAQTFIGLPVENFDPEQGIVDPEGTVYRIRTGWDEQDEQDEGSTFALKLARFFSDPNVGRIPAIVIGNWAPESSSPSESVVETLASMAEKTPKLRGFFLGDIVMEESEISWIQQTNVGPLIEAHSGLEHFRVRGGGGLSLGRLAHPRLKSLVVETGGLPVSVVREVGMADLPELEHLELWLGSANYGWDGTVEDLQPILSGRLFPKLKYLGLRDCEVADELAAVIVNSPIVRRIRTLDLSLGTLGDEGFRALTMLPRDGHLEKLDLHHHFASKKTIEEVKRLGFDVDASSVQIATKFGRFVAVDE